MKSRQQQISSLGLQPHYATQLCVSIYTWENGMLPDGVYWAGKRPPRLHLSRCPQSRPDKRNRNVKLAALYLVNCITFVVQTNPKTFTVDNFY